MLGNTLKNVPLTAFQQGGIAFFGAEHRPAIRSSKAPITYSATNRPNSCQPKNPSAL